MTTDRYVFCIINLKYRNIIQYNPSYNWITLPTGDEEYYHNVFEDGLKLSNSSGDISDLFPIYEISYKDPITIGTELGRLVVVIGENSYQTPKWLDCIKAIQNNS